MPAAHKTDTTMTIWADRARVGVLRTKQTRRQSIGRLRDARCQCSANAARCWKMLGAARMNHRHTKPIGTRPKIEPTRKQCADTRRHHIETSTYTSIHNMYVIDQTRRTGTRSSTSGDCACGHHIIHVVVVAVVSIGRACGCLMGFALNAIGRLTTMTMPDADDDSGGSDCVAPSRLS